jgi:DNA-binding transcriptional regulator YhcF (GntR family)
MPSRKADHIIRVLRDDILSGRRGPGARLPTYDALVEEFHVTRPTVARVLKALRREELVTAEGTRGLYVADTLPHQHRYLWVSSERPGAAEWTSLSATILELIECGETGLPGEIIPLLGVDGRLNNPAYETLCDAVRHGSAAGLLVMSSETTSLLPALEAPGLPRVAVSAPLPHAALVSLDFGAFVERACARMLRRGRRIAVFSPHAAHLERARASLLGRGLDKRNLMALHVGPVGCDKLTELLFERPDRPDAVLVTDDSLVQPFLAGLERAKVRPGRDVHVLAHCTWPHPIGAATGVEHIGFDARELLWASKECMEAQRAGQGCAGSVIPPRFESELLTSTSPSAQLRIAANRLGTPKASAKAPPRLSSAA